MSGNRAPPPAASPSPDQIMQSMKRQLPFSSMKPPFLASSDYHRFAPDHRRNLDHETEAIVVKTPSILGGKGHVVLQGK
ncbi:transcription factor E2F [Trifolium pratense]|uniref:Transcription factor E2F n=1 Tax=Trifolium pratense TaxID=57577 RepID=A0A2K3M2U3_TRIPR|nr:transcription factor E2F [Trifolium pratense]